MGYDIIKEVINLKENYYDGFLHFQISCNSTDEEKRKELFGGAEVESIKDIINCIDKYNITKRTVTLNFIVMEGVEVSVEKLMSYDMNPEKFTVKLIPLNNTDNSLGNDLKTYANYSNYEKLIELATEFEKHGIPVVYDAIAKCEESGLCCGQIVQGYLNE